MHRARSPRAQTIRLVIVYTAMTLVVLVALTILMLFVQGYRYNADKRSIEQGGLVQFSSRPSGATITFDNRVLSRKTATRLSTASGSHTIAIERDGFRPWQKTITVDPGSIHWLDYVMLIPDKIEAEPIYDYDQVDQSLAANQQNKLAILADKTKLSVDIVNTASNQPRLQTIAVPERLISSADDDEKSPKVSLELVAWDFTANRLMAKVSHNRQVEWLIIDTRDPAQSVNISSLFDSKQKVDLAMFDSRSSKHVYVQHGGSLYRVAYEDGTKPRPIITDIASFTQSAQGVIAFTTAWGKQSGSRSTGYFTPGADSSKTIRTYYDDGKLALNVLTGEYFDQQYLVAQYGSTVEISRFSLHPSDSDNEIAPTNIATINLEDGIEYLSFSPSERFVVAQHKSTYTTFDLELMSVDTTTVRGESAVKRQFAWLDDYHIWSDRDNELRFYEFDGANSSLISDIAPGQTPLLTNNGRYLYFVGPTGDEQQLSLLRVQLFT